MGRAGHIYNNHQRIEGNRRPQPMQQALLITATPDKQE
jgi:hypothetical protein